MPAIAPSPAFSFYAKDFLTGAAPLSLAERGAYITLLAYQWDSGGVPDNTAERARILGCVPREAERAWLRVRGKFDQGQDGQWRNARLERERDKQAARREALIANGVKGGRPKNHLDNQMPNQTETNRFPHRNQTQSLSSSSSSSCSPQAEKPRAIGAGSRAGLMSGSMPIDHGDCLAHGPICLKPRIASDLVGLFPGGQPALVAWATGVCGRWRDRVDAGERLYTADGFKFWRAEYDRDFGQAAPKPASAEQRVVPDASATAAYLRDMRQVG